MFKLTIKIYRPGLHDDDADDDDDKDYYGDVYGGINGDDGEWWRLVFNDHDNASDL